MATDEMNLPEGYSLDAPTNKGLPEGYTLDSPEPEQSALESGARGALRNFPLAQQATAGLSGLGHAAGLSTPTYGAELQHLTQAAEQGKEQNPKAYYGGATAGALAPMAIPFVGEALGAAGPALEAASGAGIAGGIAHGAAQAIPDINLAQQPGEAAKQAAIGAGVGGTLGGLGKLMGKAAPVLNKATTEEIAQRGAAATSDIGEFTGNQLKGLTSKYGADLKALPESEKLAGAKRLIGENLNTELSRAGTPIKATDSVGDVLDKASGVLDKLNKEQGDLIQTLSKSDPQLQQNMIYEAIGGFEKSAMDKYALPGQVGVPFQKLEAQGLYGPQLATAKKISRQMNSMLDNPTYAEAQDVKQTLSHTISNFNKTGDMQRSEPAMMARTIIRDSMTRNGPPRLGELLGKETMLYDSVESLSNKSRQISEGFQLPSWRNAPAGIVGYIVGHMAGGFAGGLGGGALGSYLSKTAGPQIESALYNQYPNLAKMIPQMSQAARLELANSLQSKFGEKK